MCSDVGACCRRIAAARRARGEPASRGERCSIRAAAVEAALHAHAPSRAQSRSPLAQQAREARPDELSPRSAGHGGAVCSEKADARCGVAVAGAAAVSTRVATGAFEGQRGAHASDEEGSMGSPLPTKRASTATMPTDRAEAANGYGAQHPDQARSAAVRDSADELRTPGDPCAVRSAGVVAASGDTVAQL